MHQKNTQRVCPALKNSLQHLLMTVKRKFLLTVKASERTVIGQNPSPTLYQEETHEFCRCPRKTQRDGLAQLAPL